MSVAIGIDLGTTNTVVAAVVDGVAVTLEDEHERRLLPSVVSFHPSSTVLVGEAARERRLIDPENTIFSVKPLFGRPWESDEVQSARARFPFKLVQGTKNSTMVLARDVAYSLPEISAFVLRRAKSIAESVLGQTVDRAVITVPANFNDLQRASTKIAGKLAGLEVMRILNEPTAAALAYGQSITKAEKIAVYDLGGGTFDVTLLDLTGNVFEVLATAGDTALGGDDIDLALAERIALEVVERFNVDPRTNAASAARLGFIAEEIKKELTTGETSRHEITGVGYAEGGRAISMPFEMTRRELEKLATPFIERTIDVARQSIDIIGLTEKDFDRVILVGGSTRMPLVAKMVEQLFGQPPHLKVNPDEVVALGAAIQAHALNRSKAAHKRRSAHEKLADAEPRASGERVPTRPPDANPTALPAEVPKPPPLPNFAGPSNRGDAPARPPAPLPPVPEFISFNKAPAIISFSAVPPAPTPEMDAAPNPANLRVQTLSMGADQEPRPAPGGPLPAVNVPAPGPSPMLGRGRSDHAGQPVQGRTTLPLHELVQSELDESSARPKPARRAALDANVPAFRPAEALEPQAPDDRASAPSLPGPWGDDPKVPDLWDEPQRSRDAGPSAFEAQRPNEADAVPEMDLALPSGPPVASSGYSGGIEQLVMGTELFGRLEFDKPREPSQDRFLQGSAIATSASTPLLIDVTPLSLGVETAGGYSDVLIPANTPVPCEKTRTFLTASDGQVVVVIRVAQGESSRFADNTRLGDLELSGLRPARRGEVKIAVTFELDADGILNVRARDQDTGRETKATMRLLGTNTDADDIGAMVERQARHDIA